MSTAVQELAIIGSLTHGFARSPRQINALHESDAELLTIGNGLTLAVTTDTVAEEIATGLYADPWLAGWMAVMVNFSDIAAVGADPLGIVMAEVFPAGASSGTIAKIQRGISDACNACRSFVLGGDTNTGEALVLGGTAIGLFSATTPLTRRGIRPGDRVYCTGAMGSGNAFAALMLAGKSGTIPYAPVARVREGAALRGRATACMDTSDGLLATLDQLGRLNGVGIDLHAGWLSAVDPRAIACGTATGLPPWLFLAGPHGEFELVFTVRGDGTPREQLEAAGTTCLYLGEVVEGDRIRIPGVGTFSPDQRAAIRNLPVPSSGTVDAYVAQVLQIGDSARESTAS